MAWRLAQDLASQEPWLGPGLPQLLHEFHGAAPATQHAAGLIIVEADSVSADGNFHCAQDTALPPAFSQAWVLAPLFRPDGMPRLVEHDPLAPRHRRATRFYSDVAIFDLVDGQVLLRALIEGITLHTLQMELDVELLVSPALTLLQIPTALGGSY